MLDAVRIRKVDARCPGCALLSSDTTSNGPNTEAHQLSTSSILSSSIDFMELPLRDKSRGQAVKCLANLFDKFILTAAFQKKTDKRHCSVHILWRRF